MVLYHYTSFYALKNGGTILAEGLKPNAFDPGDPQPTGVVWLTTDAEPVWWDVNDAGEGHQPRQVRIILVLPASDRRLVRYENWMEKKWPGLQKKMARAQPELNRLRKHAWYVYFGAIPLTAFRVVEPTDPARRADQPRELTGNAAPP